MESAPGATIIKNYWEEVEDDTNDDSESETAYFLETSGGEEQWIGWKFNTPPKTGQWARMSAWIKFRLAVPNFYPIMTKLAPPPGEILPSLYSYSSNDLGFDIQGTYYSDWL